MDPDTVFRQSSLVGTWLEKAGLLELGKKSRAGAEVENVVTKTIVPPGAVAPHRTSEAVVSKLVEDAVT